MSGPREPAAPRGAHALLLPSPGEDIPPERSCGWCGASDAVAPMRVARWDTDPAGPLVRCRNLRECVDRYLARVEAELADAAAARAADRAGTEARDAQEATGSALERAPAPRRARPSRARKQVPEKDAGNGGTEEEGFSE